MASGRDCASLKCVVLYLSLSRWTGRRFLFARLPQAKRCSPLIGQMNFIRKIFKSKSDQLPPVDKGFSSYVQKSITLTGTKGKVLENDKLVELLVSNGIPEVEAIEIMLFLPIAFCKKLLPQINGHPDYVDCDAKNGNVTRLYTDNPRYLIIQSETENYWTQNPDKDIVINVAGRSAEFKSINQLLLGGGQLKDISITQAHVVR